MNSTTLICKRCKAPLEYEEGSAVLRCPHCGYTEKIDESDDITRERIRAKAYKDTELGKTKIEKEADIKAKEIHLEEKNLGIKKVKYLIYAIIVVVLAALIALAVYNGQHKGKIHIKQASEFYIGTDYQLTHRLLAEAGFDNIEESPQATLTMKEKELEGKVIRVSIDGNPAFDKGWYPKDATVTIFYGILDPQRANDIRMPLSRTDCIGKNYQTIVDKMTAEGFHNIKIVPYADLSMDRKEQDGKITRITINNSEEFYLGDYFAADSIIQIDYHTLDPERMADVQIPASYDSFTEMDYLAACKEFLSAGFTNITLIPKYDVRFYEGSKSGVVQSITVNGESTFLKGIWLPYDTEVRITYRTKDLKYIGEDYQEINKMLATMGFSDIELMPLNDLEINELKKQGQVVSVLIGDIELGEAEELNLLAHIVIQYHSERQAGSNQVKITTASKDLTGKNYEEVVAALKEMGFTRVRAVALEDLSNEIIHKNGDVSEVSIGGTTKFSVGEIFDKSAEVIVSYHSLKPKPTPTPEPQPTESQVKLTVAPKDLKGENYEEVLSLLQEMGFTNVSAVALEDLSNEIIHKNGDVSEVSIGGVTKFSVGEIFDKSADVIVSYHSLKPKPTPTPEPQPTEGQVRITVAPKDLKGKDYQEVISRLQEMGFTNIKTDPLGDLKRGWIYDEGEVKEVSIGGTTKFSINDIFDSDVEIIISYHSFPE